MGTLRVRLRVSATRMENLHPNSDQNAEIAVLTPERRMLFGHL